MTIIISDGQKNHEYYDVPAKVAKAIITLLNECGNDETEIVTAESETFKSSVNPCIVQTDTITQ